MSILVSLMVLQAAAAAPQSAPKPASLSDDRKIVCRTLIGTGSRLNAERVCMSKKEWRKLGEGGEEVTREMQDQSSRRGPVQ